MAVVRFEWCGRPPFRWPLWCGRIGAVLDASFVVVPYLVADLPFELWQRLPTLILSYKKMPYLFSIKIEKRLWRSCIDCAYRRYRV